MAKTQSTARRDDALYARRAWASSNGALRLAQRRGAYFVAAMKAASDNQTSWPKTENCLASAPSMAGASPKQKTLMAGALAKAASKWPS